jgi:hypothetical protein
MKAGIIFFYKDYLNEVLLNRYLSDNSIKEKIIKAFKEEDP